LNDSSRREFFGKRRILLGRQFKKGVFLESEGYFLNGSSRREFFRKAKDTS